MEGKVSGLQTGTYGRESEGGSGTKKNKKDDPSIVKKKILNIKKFR